MLSKGNYNNSFNTQDATLRISNPAWREPLHVPGQPQEEDTDGLVLQLAADLGVDLQPWELGRSHRVGEPRPGGPPRPILVKFISYNVRKRLFDARKEIRETRNPVPTNVYINEDLTRFNSKLAYDARTLKRQNQIHDTFTRDGRTFIKKTPTDKAALVKNCSHLHTIVNSPRLNQIAGRQQSLPARTNIGGVTNSATVSSLSALSLSPAPSPLPPNNALNMDSQGILITTPTAAPAFNLDSQGILIPAPPATLSLNFDLQGTTRNTHPDSETQLPGLPEMNSETIRTSTPGTTQKLDENPDLEGAVGYQEMEVHQDVQHHASGNESEKERD